MRDENKVESSARLVIVIVTIVAAVIICVFSCCATFSMSREKQADVIEQTPEEPLAVETLKVLYECNQCKKEQERVHTLAIDGIHVADICSECVGTLISLLYKTEVAEDVLL